MKLLITGGAGYIGNELTNILANDAKIEEIIIYDNLSRKNFNSFLQTTKLNSNIRFVKGDILDSRKLRESLTGVDIVVHLAAKVSTPFANQDPHYLDQVNQWGTAELIYAVEQSSVSKFIYTSSTSVYGDTPKAANEDTTPKPITFYGISKYKGESHVERLGKHINAHVVRCGNVYGISPSMRFDAVINHLMFDANFTNKISISGNGNQSRAFIHIQKLTRALYNLIESDVDSGTYNLVDKNLTVLEVAETIKVMYPGLEYLFINQELGLRNLNVNPKSKISDCFDIQDSELLDELKEFKDKFSY